MKNTRGEENRPRSSLTRAQDRPDIDESFEFNRHNSILNFADIIEKILNYGPEIIFFRAKKISVYNHLTSMISDVNRTMYSTDTVALALTFILTGSIMNIRYLMKYIVDKY